MLTKASLIFTLLLIIITNCSSVHIVKIEESIFFPETGDVEILADKPDSAHVVIALLEVSGGSEKTILSALNEMEIAAAKLGADALIARLIRLKQMNSQEPFKIRGTAIKYASSIRRLTRNNVRLVFSTRPLTIGGSFNLISPAVGGWGWNGWISRKNLRFRTEMFKLNTPGFFWKDGFEKGRISSSLNFNLDYFINKPNKGLYLSAGLGMISGSVGHKNETTRGSHKNTTLNLGGGYSFPLTSFLNINAAFSGQVITGGKREFYVGSRPAIISSFYPCFSVNLEVYW